MYIKGLVLTSFVTNRLERTAIRTIDMSNRDGNLKTLPQAKSLLTRWVHFREQGIPSCEITLILINSDQHLPARLNK